MVRIRLLAGVLVAALCIGAVQYISTSGSLAQSQLEPLIRTTVTPLGPAKGIRNSRPKTAEPKNSARLTIPRSYLRSQADVALRSRQSRSDAQAVRTTSPDPRRPCESPFATQKFGYVADHFNYCSVNSYLLQVLQCVTPTRCTEISRATFKMALIGVTAHGSRKVGLTALTFDWQTQPLAGSRQLTLGIICTNFDQARCAHKSASSHTRTVSQWAAAPTTSVTFALASAASAGDGVDKIARHGFYLQLAFGAAPPLFQELNGFRCDSADYRPAKKGCVFYAVILIFTGLSLSDRIAGEHARHVFDALNRPDATNPPKLGGGKRMPGAPGDVPLRYFDRYDRKRIAATNRLVRSACDKYYPRRTKKAQCDEYPFKSTREAAGSGDDYSVRAICARGNCSGGGYLSGSTDANACWRTTSSM